MVAGSFGSVRHGEVMLAEGFGGLWELALVCHGDAVLSFAVRTC